ncbi:MAG: putative surface protein with fasciclin (FAS1) repeats [Oceanicoccus sp.]|jgi:uncharacterized surface protein with fasciclin (FAS1) repeats
MKFLRYLSVAFLFVVLAACSDNSDGPYTSVVDIAIDNGDFTTLIAALEATGLDSTLDSADGSFTVFAPTDAAFAKLGEDAINDLLANPTVLSDILLYHVISGPPIDAATAIASAGQTIVTANGERVALSLSGSDLLVNTSTVIDVDLRASNGIVHVIDTVLLPPAESEEPIFNIAEVATNDGRFTTLLVALAAAGLDGALADDNATYTVFAPTNAAFDALPAGTVTALLADIPALTDILNLHVISGAAVDSITALSLSGTEVATLGGDTIALQIIDGALMVGNAKVTTFDIVTTNGIIHVIDAVILN